MPPFDDYASDIDDSTGGAHAWRRGRRLLCRDGAGVGDGQLGRDRWPRGFVWNPSGTRLVTAERAGRGQRPDRIALGAAPATGRGRNETRGDRCPAVLS